MRLRRAKRAALQEVRRFSGDLKNDDPGVALKHDISFLISDFFCRFNSPTWLQLFIVHRNLLCRWGWPDLCPGRSKGWEWTARRRGTRGRWLRRTGSRRRTGRVLSRCDWGTSRSHSLAAAASWLTGVDKCFLQWRSLATCVVQKPQSSGKHLVFNPLFAVFNKMFGFFYCFLHF